MFHTQNDLKQRDATLPLHFNLL